jgi:predicted alpha/beta-hydrolase family hydrolase
VSTPRGPARLHIAPPLGRPDALLVLGHGAGGGVDAPDLVAMATQLPLFGFCVVRVEQPWRVSGRRVAPAPAQLDEAWVPAAARARAWVRDRWGHDVPLLAGGRSAGARVACRTASVVGARAVVALAFPLHPPGRPGVSRADELLAAADSGPVLVVQGSRDAFGTPGQLRGFPDVSVAAIAGADHAFRVGRRPPGGAVLTTAEAGEAVCAAARRWWWQQS